MNEHSLNQVVEQHAADLIAERTQVARRSRTGRSRPRRTTRTWRPRPRYPLG